MFTSPSVYFPLTIVTKHPKFPQPLQSSPPHYYSMSELKIFLLSSGLDSESQELCALSILRLPVVFSVFRCIPRNRSAEHPRKPSFHLVENKFRYCITNTSVRFICNQLRSYLHVQFPFKTLGAFSSDDCVLLSVLVAYCIKLHSMPIFLLDLTCAHASYKSHFFYAND